MKAVLKEPGKIPVAIEIENSLEALQEAVGGYIETVGVTDDTCLIYNEEGVLLGLGQQQVLGATFCGNVLFVGMEGDHFTDVPEIWIPVYAREMK